MQRVMGYERPNIRQLTAYAPGEQPKADPTNPVIKLNTNENPYPPSDAVLNAIRSVDADALRRYPPPTADRFRRVAAEAHGLEPDQIIATNGGDELLRLVLTVFCRPRTDTHFSTMVLPGGVGVTQPTYSLYPVLAAIHDTPITQVPLREDFSLPTDLADRLNDTGCRLAILVNPHAPSGQLRAIDVLEQIARTFAGVLLIDEAYVDFASHDALPLLQAGAGLDNVLILRTLSKGYSLAGLRFGYGLGHRDLIASLDKARDSYNTDVLSQTAAIAALEHRDQAAMACRAVIAERTRLTGELTRRGFCVLDSEANFLLATPPAPHQAGDLYQQLKSKNILVRYFDQDRLRDKLRITVGTRDQNNTLLAALGT